MDFLELNACSIQHNIDYGVPRLFHVDNADFKLLTQFDRIQSSGMVCFGAIDVSFFLSNVLCHVFIYFCCCCL
jgi:hypothetical protein